jgi:hypothetical protein
MAVRSYEICIDAVDPDLPRPFWRAALGYVDQPGRSSAVFLAASVPGSPASWMVPPAKTTGGAGDVLVMMSHRVAIDRAARC